MSLNSYIARQFSHPTGLGGKIVTAVMNRQNRPMYEETKRLLLLSASDNVLDIGCGNGYVLNLFAKQYSCTFTGIDISDSIIKAASHRNRNFIRDRKMRFSCQNVESMIFKDDSFTKAFTINTVYFWDNLEKTMVEIYRIMKPQGIFINTLYSNETLNRFSHTQFGYKQHSAKHIIDASKHAGFMVNTVPIIRGAAYCVCCNKL
jgi:ubiquinone/menaquinone biosynthesis C-methylase UbiE